MGMNVPCLHTGQAKDEVHPSADRDKNRSDEMNDHEGNELVRRVTLRGKTHYATCGPCHAKLALAHQITCALITAEGLGRNHAAQTVLNRPLGAVHEWA